MYIRIKWGRDGHWNKNHLALTTETFEYSPSIDMNITFSINSQFDPKLDRIVFDVVKTSWFGNEDLGSTHISFQHLYEGEKTELSLPLVHRKEIKETRLNVSITAVDFGINRNSLVTPKNENIVQNPYLHGNDELYPSLYKDINNNEQFVSYELPNEQIDHGINSPPKYVPGRFVMMDYEATY